MTNFQNGVRPLPKFNQANKMKNFEVDKIEKKMFMFEQYWPCQNFDSLIDFFEYLKQTFFKPSYRLFTHKLKEYILIKKQFVDKQQTKETKNTTCEIDFN